MHILEGTLMSRLFETLFSHRENNKLGPFTHFKKKNYKKITVNLFVFDLITQYVHKTAFVLDIFYNNLLTHG